MISSIKTNRHGNLCDLVVDRDGKYAIVLANPKAMQCMDFFVNAPSSNRIDFSSNKVAEIDLERISYSDSFSDLSLRRSDLSLREIASIKKRVQALLVKFGYSVKDIYGIKCGDTIYGYDYGFDAGLGSINAYCNFNMIHKDKYDRRVYGFDFTNLVYKYSKKRECGFFDNNVFNLDGSFIPFEISRMFSDVPNSNIMRFANLSILIRNVYTYLDPNVISIISLADNSIKASLSTVDAIEIANVARKTGADIFKKIATSSRLTSGYSNVATAKVMSADAIEKVGDMVLINNGHSNLVEAQAEYMENKFRFLNQSYTDEEIQYKLMHSASTMATLLGQLSVVESTNVNRLISDCLSKMNEYQLNKENHFILSENGSIIGFLPNDNAVVGSAISDIGRTKINNIIFIDDMFVPNDFKNVASEYADRESILISLHNELEYYKSMAALINFDDIISNINRVDGYVFDCFKSLASLIASQELINARAAVYLKAVEQILKFPLKTAYGAVSFGVLAEFIDVVNNEDGTSTVKRNDTLNPFIPYQRALYQRQCGRDWRILNADPGIGLENDILVGAAYASSLSDLQGHFLSCQSKVYVKTNKQTRGSGKSEQTVIPETKLEPRIVMKFDLLLTEVIRFLNTLLNNDIMIAAKQIGGCVASVSEAVKRYSSMRKPFLEKLITLQEYEEQIFMTNHFITLAKNRFDDGFISYGNDCYLEEVDSDRHEVEIARINSVINLIDKKDVNIDSAIYSEQFIKLANEMHDLREELYETLNGLLYGKYDDEDVQEKISSMDMYPNAVYEMLELDMYNDIFEDVDVDPDRIPEVLSGVKSIRYKLVFFTYDDELDELQSRLAEVVRLVEAYNEKYKEKLTLVNDLKKAMQKAYDEQEFISLSDDVVLVRDDDELQARTNHGVFIFSVEKEHTPTEFITKLIFKDIRDNDTSYLENFIINIGTFSYDLAIFLRQLGIYNNIPFLKKVGDKLKYSVFGRTDVDNSELITYVRNEIGMNESVALSRWMAKENDNAEDILSAIIVACISNPEVALTYILAMQELNLGLYLKQKGLAQTSVACYSDKTRFLIS